jgi:RIO-like serine/threonine protein kinase
MMAEAATKIGKTDFLVFNELRKNQNQFGAFTPEELAKTLKLEVRDLEVSLSKLTKRGVVTEFDFLDIGRNRYAISDQGIRDAGKVEAEANGQ